jgi:hypothetical protein
MFSLHENTNVENRSTRLHSIMVGRYNKFIKLIMFVHTTQRTAVLIKEKHQAFFKACMD